jgi:hypothetical protein
MVDVYEELGQLKVSTATGGSTTTVVDSKLSGEGKNDDWNGGFIVVIHDVAGTGSAPQGEFQRISDYTASTGTFTFTAMTAAPANGDTYGYTGALYPPYQVIQSINRALRSLGYIDLVDTTTLDTEDNKTEYSASLSWKHGMGPKRIDVQTYTDDADGNDNRWETIYDWEFIPATAGSTGLIIFDRQLTKDYDLRIWYEDLHPDVRDYSDVIHESIPPVLAKYASLVSIMRWQVARTAGTEPYMMEQLNDYKTEMERMMRMHKKTGIQRPAKINVVK